MAKLTIDLQKLHNIGNEISQVMSKKKKDFYGYLSKKHILTSTFFVSYLAAVWSTLGNYWEDSLTPLILISGFFQFLTRCL